MLAALAVVAREAAMWAGAGNTISIGGDVGQSIAGNQTNTGPMSFSVGKRK